MNVGSLFSGIGGIELGLERAGMQIVWQVESDDYARAVLAKHWPDTERFADVRRVGRQNLAPVDLICGGFPCQDVSVAGKGKGIQGKQSSLWKEFARIIKEMQPTWVLIENVPALRSRGMEVVLRDLSESGYDAEWDCIPAAAFGAPHRRDRLFIIAYPNRFFVWHESGRRCRPRWEDKTFFSREGWWSTKSKVGRVAHGVPSRVDRLKCLGNAVVPQVAEAIGRLILHAQRTS